MTEQPHPQLPPPSGAPLELPATPAVPATNWGLPRNSGPRAQAPPRAMPNLTPESILARAKNDDPEAIQTMFGQFLPQGEQVLDSHYLGVLGLWGIGQHSFAAVTPRRFATLRISFAGGVQYQDGSLELINASAIFQPSKVMLYVTAALVSLGFVILGMPFGALGVILLLGLSVVLLPLTVRLHYRFHKSGIVLWVREGMPLYAFIDRKHMRLANQLYRLASNVRDDRLRTRGHP